MSRLKLVAFYSLIASAAWVLYPSQVIADVTGVFDRHEVKVTWWGMWVSDREEDPLVLKESKYDVEFKGQSSDGFAEFDGTLKLDFPDLTPPGSFGSLNFLDFNKDPMVVKLTVDGTWTMESVPEGNSWVLESRVGPADLPGSVCPISEEMIGPPISVSETVSVTSSCERSSLKWPSEQGVILLYVLHSFAELTFRLPGVPTFVGVTVDVYSYYYIPYCPDSAKVELIGLEVNQSIQDWENSVTLIEGKDTWVRAHIQPIDNKGNAVSVYARLLAFRDGVELTPQSPLAPTPNKTFVARTNAARRRGKGQGSLNFQLPDEWLSGTVNLSVKGDGTEICCKEVAGRPNDCSVQVTFNSTDELKVKFVAVPWTDSGGTTHNPTEADLEELAKRLVAIYPIAGLDWTKGSLPWTGAGPPDLDTLLDKLYYKRERHYWENQGLSIPHRLYYGVLLGPDQGGLGHMPGTVSAGTMPATAFTYGRNKHAHELGHNLDLAHAANSSLGTNPAGTRKLGPCDSDAPLKYPDFPYIEKVSGANRATLGPMTLGDNRLIYGIDTHSERVVDPNDNFELMSYCGTSWKWISKFTYEGVRTAINNRFTGSISKSLGPMSDYLIVRGTVDFKNDTAEFLPFGVISSPVFPPVPPVGDYILQMLDATGNIVTDVSFQPTEIVADFPAEDPGIGTFLIPVLADPAIKGAVVLHSGNTLASKSASENFPTVHVLFPNGDENLSDNPVTLKWTGSDLDGDTLTYLVQYSHDGGLTWNTLAIDWPEESYELDRTYLKGSNNGLIRVMVSDGFNTSADESDGPFSVPNNAPMVSIIKPTTDERFIGDQLVFFKAMALDMEDEAILDSNLQWSSSVDGSLGTGSKFTVEASNLSEGNHEITLTAVDSESSSKSVSVNISVVRTIDADGDDLPDDWEQQVIDADPNDAIKTLDDVKPDQDLDGDGESNWIEYTNDTDPTDPMSARRGDTNDDKYIDLADAITALQVVSGVDIDSQNLTVAGDLSDDQRIGLEEVIYILQKVSELR